MTTAKHTTATAHAYLMLPGRIGRMHDKKEAMYRDGAPIEDIREVSAQIDRMYAALSADQFGKLPARL